jgi:hypothetical protein
MDNYLNTKKSLQFYINLLLAFLVIDIFLFCIYFGNFSRGCVYLTVFACRNNMSQIAYACQSYIEHYDSLPIYTVDKDNKPLHSWRVLILPFLGEPELKKLYDSIRLDESWDSEYNKQFHNEKVIIYQCSTLRRQFPNLPINSYFLVTGAGSLVGESKELSFDNFKNRDHEMPFLVESPKNITWMSPIDIPFDEYNSPTFLSNIEFHSVVTYHDCSSKILKRETSYQILGPKEYYFEILSFGGSIIAFLITIFAIVKIIILTLRIYKSQ